MDTIFHKLIERMINSSKKTNWEWLLVSSKRINLWIYSNYTLYYYPQNNVVMKLCSLILILSLGFFSCSEKTQKYTLIYSSEEPIGDIVKTMETVVERELDIELELIIGDGSLAALDSLTKGTADFTIVENYSLQARNQITVSILPSSFPYIL